MSSTAAGLTFLSWYRRGLAAGIAPASGGLGLDAGLPAQATLHLQVSINGVLTGDFDAYLHSPGDVAGFDANQVIRTDPAPGASNVETSYFPLIEFARADLPWMLTPNAPQRGKTTDADPRRGLRPWLVLVVIPAGAGTILTPVSSGGLTQGSALPVLTTTVDQLPDLSESWWWAHAQVLTTGAAGETVEGVIESEPHRALSRLIAPRRLHPNTAYVACLVPAFDASRDAGLEPAWQAGDGSVTLPVYYSWEFRTGAGGDFESLVRLLKRYDSADAGTRRLDIGHAGSGMPGPAAGKPAWELNLEGVLVGSKVQPGQWDDSVPQTTVQDALAKQLDGTPDELTPPIYGSSQAEFYGPRPETNPTPLSGFDTRTHQCFHGSLAAAGGATWLRTLNLDPRYRVVAALGTEVVQRYQEALMASAWEQAAELRKANQMLARGQLAREVNSRIYQVRVGANSASAPLADDRLMQVTAAIHSQVNAPPPAGASAVGGSIAAVVAQNASLQASLTTSFRRITRPLGPFAKRALVTPLPLPVHSIASGSAKVTPELLPVSGQVTIDKIAKTDQEGKPEESLGEISPDRVSRAVFPWESQPAVVQAESRVSQAAAVPGPPAFAIPYGFMSDLVVTTGPGPTPGITSWAGRAADFMGVPQLGWARVSPLLGLALGFTDVALTYVDFAGRNGVIIFMIDREIVQRSSYEWWSGYPLDGSLFQTTGAGGKLPSSIGVFIPGAVAVAATDLTGSGNIDLVFVWSRELTTEPDTVMIVGRGLDASGTITGGWTGLQKVGPKTDSLSVTAMGQQLCILSGNELRVVTLDATGTVLGSAVSDRFRAQLPPDFVTGSIAAAAFGVEGMDLVFCYSAGTGNALRAGYRLAFNVQPDGTIGGWGEPLPLPFPGASEMQLLLGVMTSASASLRTRQTKAFRDAAVATQARQQRVLSLAVAPPAPPAVSNFTPLAQQLRSAIDPHVTVPASVLGRLQLDPHVTVPASVLSRLPSAIDDKAAVSDALQPAVCSPYFPQPMYEAFRDLHPDRFVPGGFSMPDNRVTLLQADTKVIEAYLVGLNAEMARSFLWHGFPGNLQATYFDRFWDALDAGGAPLHDISAINGWTLASDLGSHAPGAATGAPTPVVLAVRGELLRRIPHATIYAAPAKASNGGRTVDVSGRLDPWFTGRLNPDVALFGFNLSATQVRGNGGTPGWYFVFQEHPTAPRFGLEEPPADASTYGSKPARWRDLDWSEVVTSKAAYDTLTYLACSQSPLAGVTLTDSGAGNKHRFGFSAAHMAHILFKPAVQVAIHGSLLLCKGE